MVGIRKIKINKKQNSIKIDTYRTDYYTHRVMARLYADLLDDNYINAPEDASPETINKYYYFLTSMGMDALTIINSERIIPLGIRSKLLFTNNEKENKEDKLHLSMNEAVSITDMENLDSKPSMDTCLKRGLIEELNIDLSIYKNNRTCFSDFFLLKNPLEFGISAFVSIDENDFGYNNFELCYYTAKDREFETVGLEKVNDSVISIRRLIKRSDSNNSKYKMSSALKYVLGIYMIRKLYSKIAYK